jgi:drug/metabolite transporter (DMT)-like permease
MCALLFVAAIWGATFFLIKDATAEYSLMAFLVLRWLIAGLTLLPFCWRLGRLPSRAEWRWGVGAGVLFSSGYLFQIVALRLIDSGRVGFITGLYVVVVPILALLVLRYPLKPRILISSGLAVAGMVLLSGAPGGNWAGDLAAFLCAVSFAGQILVVEKFPTGMDWRYVSLIQAALVTLMGLVLMPVFAAFSACQGDLCPLLARFADPLPTTLPLTVIAVAAFTGVFASAIGLVAQVWAQRVLPPSDAALVYAAESPLAAVFGVVFRGEVLTPLAIIGCVLIMTSMVTLTLGASPATSRRQHPLRPRLSARLAAPRSERTRAAPPLDE